MRIRSKLTSANTQIRNISLLILYLIPLVLLIVFVSNLGVNIPFGDQWALLPYFEKIQAGEITFLDIVQQHNEHRIVLPRLAFSTLAFATDWNTRSEMALSIVVASISFCTVFLISSKTSEAYSSQQRILFHVVNFISCCLLFSFVQHENWLWGFQPPWFFINVCVTSTILVLIQNKIPAGWRLIGGALFCCMASLSSAHGLFVWLATTPSVVAMSGSIRKRATRLAIWIVMFLGCLAVYLVGYQRPPHAQDYYTTSLANYVGHFFVSIGAPLLRGHSLFSSQWDNLIVLINGILIFFSFIAITSYVVLNIKRINKTSHIHTSHRQTHRQNGAHLFLLITPWISLGTYSIIFSLVNSYGRSGAGIAQALSSRYTTPNSLITIALLQMLLILINYWCVPVSKKIAVGIIALFCAINIKTGTASVAEATYGDYGAITRERQTICAELVFYMSDDEFKKCIERNVSANKESFIRLNQLGFRQFPNDIEFTDIETLSTSEEAPVAISLADPNLDIEHAKVSGKLTWPSNSTITSQPRAVLLAVENEQRFVGVADLDLSEIGKGNELPWETALTREITDDIEANDHSLTTYLYYPEQKAFVRVGEPIGKDMKS
ncbi:MAG: hypothetical protein AAF703_18240 [Cyanobacteria bacterium P01_D01_bin.105]